MSKHSDSFSAERVVPASEAAPALASPVTAEAVTAEAVSAPPARKRSTRTLLLAAAALATLTAGGYYGHDYWTVGRFNVSTDDAYVKADSTTVAPKVSGYIGTVLVADNEPVKTGQVLARIDDRDFAAALRQAKADVEAAQAALAGKQVQLDAQQSVIDSARATVDLDRANSAFAEQDDQRYAKLAASGYGSQQNAQQAASRIAAARATIDRDVAALTTAQKQVDLLKADIAQAQATLAHDEAVQHQAELNLSYTSILSPVDGVVGNRTLRTGQYVQAGTQLMSVVPLAGTYIVANYKETQLTDVRPGQKVEIDVDMFPGVAVSGHVDSMAPASGQEFALLPPDNATGNFTKVVQRIPVKIVLDAGNPLAGSLRPGMSVNPIIQTKADTATASAQSTLAAAH